MLISEVVANTGSGRNLLLEIDPTEIIKAIIELPLRKACEIFWRKGIRTVMSSANRNNIVQNKADVIEKENIISPKEYMTSDNKPTYEEAGKGYAWIMLDFDSLSDENKDLLFSLEEARDGNGNPIGEKGIWFVSPKESTIVENDDRLSRFENKRILLAYNNDSYPNNVVILRYPVNENSTVEEVEEFFAAFARGLKKQKVIGKDYTDFDEETMQRINRFRDMEMDIN